MSTSDEQVMEDTSVTPEEEAEIEQEAPELETEEAEDEEDVDTLKARLAKAEELANNYKIRAEKAEKKPKAPTIATPEGLSTADIIALTRATIDDEDIEEVVEYAKIKKISVGEALKTDVMKATLAIREEKRKSAQAVHTGTARKAPSGQTDERLLENARSGKLPDNDADIAKLAELRLKQKRK